ncbi:MAG: diguanylate cyclase response regulator [Holosporaceae bacterium]|jgi:diguanylate cyclase (GGDEF)-like protein|nr:diguanylate cyclase response regulator [Holosporaceae bacterium]
MVAKILVINECNIDISSLCDHLRELHNILLFARSFEDSIRIVRTQFVDLILICIPSVRSRIFIDFLAVLRQLCGVIPIISVTGSGLTEFVTQCRDIGLDDIIEANVNKKILARKIAMFVQIKDMFHDNLLNNIQCDTEHTKKVATIFHENTGFLRRCLDESSGRFRIFQTTSWPAVDDTINRVDLFVINSEVAGAYHCCAGIRLRKIYKHVPILLTRSENDESEVKQAAELNLGFMDTIATSSHPTIISCRINSLIKYKRLYENFSQNIEKNMYQSTIDATTGVLSRTFLEDYIKNHTHQLHNCAVLMVDIDKFKDINDRFGHAFADEMLKCVASTVKMYIRSSDMIARYGGDEFIIIIDNINMESANHIALRIQKTVENSVIKNATCTVSIGICCPESDGRLSLQDAIAMADEFMYLAKQQGGNSVKICA